MLPVIVSNRVGYATILANWMESLVDGAEPTLEEAPSASMAFSQKQPSSMLERIQRILKPDAKPDLRVSTVNLVFVLAASLLIACVFNALRETILRHANLEKSGPRPSLLPRRTSSLLPRRNFSPIMSALRRSKKNNATWRFQWR